MKPFFRFLLLCGLTVSPLAASHGQQSRIELRSFHSAALGIDKSYNIYLPAGYDSSSERYPVIYLFRGHEREWANPYEDNSRQGRTVKNDADDLIAAGKIGNVILVMPGMSSADNAVPACAVNLRAPERAASREGLGTGRFEDYLVGELIPYIDQHFRTIPTRSFRAADGFSLGGYTSMMLGTKHPELFTSVGAFDGTLMWLDFTNPARPGTLNDLWVTNAMFDPMFNVPRDIPYMTSYNEANLIKNASARTVSALKQMQFYIDATPAGNDDRAQHVVSLLAEKGIPNAAPSLLLSSNAQHSWYYADIHAMRTFPKHWRKFQTPIATLQSPMTGPASGTSVSGVVSVNWMRGLATTTPATTMLEVSNDGGARWQTLSVSTAADSSFNWDTRRVSDGTRYKLRLLVMAGDSSLGYSESAGTFTVNNPGNGVPDAILTAPSEADTLEGETAIRWNAADADGDALTITIDFSADGGTRWKTVASGLSNTGSYLWKTTEEVNSARGRIRLRVSDGQAVRESVSPIFVVNNPRSAVTASFKHLSGSGDGTILPVRIGSGTAWIDQYRITFNDSASGGRTTYSVFNLSQNKPSIENEPITNGLEGPLFDGMRLVITNYASPQPSSDSTKWIRGSSTLEAAVSLPEINLGTEALKGTAYAADYLITIADHVTDTSGTFLDAAPVPMKFSVWNRTEARKAEVIFNDNDMDASLSRNDELYFIEKDKAGTKMLTWQAVFPANETYVHPASGDMFLIKILKPFTARDVIIMSPPVSAVGDDASRAPEGFRLEQNYPNPFNPSTRIRFFLARTSPVRLAIYDVLGREVAVLVNGRMEAGSHSVEWNAGAASSGIYFYRIDAGAYSATRKLAVVR
ncbi:MAG: alpha/beta hydrolase-fold protein [Acidobacteriota bacterium]